METLDQTRPLHRVTFTAAAARSLGAADGAAEVLRRALPLLLVAVAAEAVGVARRVLDMAVEYAKVREQYGRVIGSFQPAKTRRAPTLLPGEAAPSAASRGAPAPDRARAPP